MNNLLIIEDPESGNLEICRNLPDEQVTKEIVGGELHRMELTFSQYTVTIERHSCHLQEKPEQTSEFVHSGETAEQRLERLRREHAEESAAQSWAFDK